MRNSKKSISIFVLVCMLFSGIQVNAAGDYIGLTEEKEAVVGYEYEEVLPECLGDLNTEGQLAVKRAISLSENEPEETANFLNECDEATFEVGVREVLNRYFEDVNQIDEQKICLFSNTIDDRANDIIDGYREALQERKNQENLNYKVGEVAVIFEEGTDYNYVLEIARHLNGDLNKARVLNKLGKSIEKCIVDGDAVTEDSLIVQFDIGIGQTVDRAEELLENVKKIHSVEANYYCTLDSIDTNDPNLENQFYLDQINVTDAWTSINSSYNMCDGSLKETTVAVIDSGVDFNHEDLKNVISPDSITIGETDDNGNYKSLFDCDTPYYSGHGTHVSGIIAATSNNSVGTAGITSVYNSGKNEEKNLCNILAINVGDGNSQGLLNSIYIVEAIYYAIEKNVDVINMSFSTDENIETWEKALNKAHDAGIILVASAGNTSIEENRYPASYDNVIAVAALDVDGTSKWDDSTYGSNVDIAAPGVSIVSTKAGTTSEVIGYKGTSMAAPMVAATAAFMRALNPDISTNTVENYIKQSADDLYTAGWDQYTGYGRINVGRAVQMAKADAFLSSKNQVGVIAETANSSTITLSLQIMPLTEYYIVERAESASGEYKIFSSHISLADVKSNRVTVNDLSVKLGKTYYYKIIDCIDAYSADEQQVVSISRNSDPTAIKAISKLEKPTVRQSPMYSNSILIDYSDEYTAFYIWRSNDSSDTSFRIIGSTQNKYYIDSGASSGNTYYYKVYAYKMVDGTPYYSDLSDAVKLTVD